MPWKELISKFANKSFMLKILQIAQYYRNAATSDFKSICYPPEQAYSRYQKISLTDF